MRTVQKTASLGMIFRNAFLSFERWSEPTSSKPKNMRHIKSSNGEIAMPKNHTVYSLTKHCQRADDVAAILSGLGLGRGAIVAECRKLANSRGPRAHVYNRVVSMSARLPEGRSDEEA
jgi:hypothetical protein